MKRFFLNRNNNYPLGNGREKVWKDGRGRKSQTHKRLWINYDLSQLGFLSIDFTSLRWTIFCSHFIHIFHLSLNRNPSVFCCEQEGKNSPKKKNWNKNPNPKSLFWRICWSNRCEYQHSTQLSTACWTYTLFFSWFRCFNFVDHKQWPVEISSYTWNNQKQYTQTPT